MADRDDANRRDRALAACQQREAVLQNQATATAEVLRMVASSIADSATSLDVMPRRPPS
jgi:hypothetical protein